MKELMWTGILGILLFGTFFYALQRIVKPIENDLQTHQTLYILDEDKIDEVEKSVYHYLNAIENNIKINMNNDLKYRPPKQCKIGKEPHFCKISSREYIYVGIIEHYPSNGKILFNNHGHIIGGYIKIYRFRFKINPDGTLTRNEYNKKRYY